MSLPSLRTNAVMRALWRHQEATSSCPVRHTRIRVDLVKDLEAIGLAADDVPEARAGGATSLCPKADVDL